MSDSTRRVLPVVRWLQIGAAAAGLGMAMAAAPAVAWADDSPGPSDSANQPSARGNSEGTHQPAARRGSGAAAAVGDSGPGSRRGTRVSAQTTVSRGSDTLDLTTATGPAAAIPAPSAALAAPAPVSAVVAAPKASAAAPSAKAVEANAGAAPAPVSAVVAAPKASAAAPSAKAVEANAGAAPAPAPSAAPGLGAFSSALRLNIQDLFSGGVPKVTKPTEVVTGLFQQVLRRDPTANELQGYVRDLNLFGVNAVIAGLYSSDAFRQNAVNNYYFRLLNRVPTQQELNVGVLQYTLDSALGSPESYAASMDLAGGREFYNYSASGGGPNGSQPSATSYVNLLYRSFLGQKTSLAAPPYVKPEALGLIERIQKGLPTLLAANQFVKSDAYREVTVGSVYQVLGYNPDDKKTEIAGYVKNWIWSGGQAGISQSLLSTTDNIGRIEQGGQQGYRPPDFAAAGVLQQLLLAPYKDYVDPLEVPDKSKWGFNQLYAELISKPYPPLPAPTCPGGPACEDPAAWELIKNGGTQRGIPNNSSSNTLLDKAADPDPTKPKPIDAAPFSLKMNPTQNEINLDSSLGYRFGPLRNADLLQTYFDGGVIKPFSNVITADNGTYIVDGHHRWSQIYLINPNTQIVAQDLGYVPTPKVALKQTQFGVVADTGALKQSQAGTPNIYDVPRAEFDRKISEFILGTDPLNPLPSAGPVIATFGKNISTPAEWDGLTGPQKMIKIQDYIWKNVLLMREKNPPIPEATSRKVMPQVDDNDKVLNGLAGGSVIFSFPVIAALG